MSVDAVAGSDTIEGGFGLDLDGEYGDMVAGELGHRTVKPSADELEMEEAASQKIRKLHQMLMRATTIRISDNSASSTKRTIFCFDEESKKEDNGTTSAKIKGKVDSDGNCYIGGELRVKKDLEGGGNMTFKSGGGFKRDSNGKTKAGAEAEVEFEFPF